MKRSKTRMFPLITDFQHTFQEQYCNLTGLQKMFNTDIQGTSHDSLLCKNKLVLLSRLKNKLLFLCTAFVYIAYIVHESTRQRKCSGFKGE